MIVAVDKCSLFGTAESFIETRKQLMVVPCLPRFAREGDVFEGRILIHNNTGADGTAQLKMTVTDELGVQSEIPSTVAIKDGGQSVELFNLKAKREGEAKLRFEARLGNQTDKIEVRLPVRSTCVTQVFSASGEVNPVVMKQIQLPQGVDKERATIELILSRSSAPQFLSGLEYLIQYPYG
jgi:uncharacterized protein YfaS (alpha-2-macroglobulin family)